MHTAPEVRATPIELQQLDDARRGAAVAAAALTCVVHSTVDPRLHAEAAHLRSVLVAAADALAAMRASGKARPVSAPVAGPPRAWWHLPELLPTGEGGSKLWPNQPASARIVKFFHTRFAQFRRAIPLAGRRFGQFTNEEPSR